MVEVSTSPGVTPDLVEAEVRTFAVQQAAAVFKIWAAGGKFMARRKKAMDGINALAEKHGQPFGANRVIMLQLIGWEAYAQHDAGLTEQWDAAIAREAEAIERAAGARRRRLHHVRSVFR